MAEKVEVRHSPQEQSRRGAPGPSFPSLRSDFRRFDRPWNAFLTPFSDFWDVSESGVAPTCDIEETDDTYYLCLDMPGISKENIDIQAQGNCLTVSGERRRE